MPLDPARPRNTYVREDKLLPHLPWNPAAAALQARAAETAKTVTVKAS
jgi:hypothetical protein